VPQAEAGSVLAAMQAARTVFRREARAIMTARQAPWPAALEEAVLRYQAAELGW
jgi:cob(I)alamin adenosyltransferase